MRGATARAQGDAVRPRPPSIDASGGRSIVETLPGQVNGYNVALSWWDEGYRPLHGHSRSPIVR